MELFKSIAIVTKSMRFHLRNTLSSTNNVTVERLLTWLSPRSPFLATVPVRVTVKSMVALMTQKRVENRTNPIHGGWKERVVRRKEATMMTVTFPTFCQTAHKNLNLFSCARQVVRGRSLSLALRLYSSA